MRLGDLLEPRGDTHQGRRDDMVRYALRSAVSGLAGVAVADVVRDTAGPPRDPDERRRLYGDPSKYLHDVLGWRLTGQQETILEAVATHDRLLVAAANNVGKTWLFAGYGVYEMDAGGAVPDPVRELDERGTILLLPGPDHDTIRASIWREILMHLRRALARGVGMPGEWSEKSVLWRTRPDWFAEAFAPMQRVGREVAHTVSGRHHEHMVAIIEEGQGVEETIWRGVEGMCSGAGNKILSPFNPTEPIGAAYARAQSGAYHVIHIDAFGHPNVRSRSVVVPAAISHTTIDMRVRTQCVDRGVVPLVHPDPAFRDFVYALPPQLYSEEHGGRGDGVPGHPDGELHVYRPNGLFQGQVLGQWPDTTNTGLFDLQTINAAMARWKEHPEPSALPDRIGVDAAREGDDDSVTAPAWGESAEALLRAWAEARTAGDAAVAHLTSSRRARVGQMRVMAKGNGPDVAKEIYALYPRSPWNVDDGGVGVSVLDHAAIVMGVDATGVSFGGLPPDPTPGEPWSENMRTAMYVRAAMLLARHLVDIPADPLLREELIAHRIEHKTRMVDEIEYGEKRRVRVASVQLIEKKKVKQQIGRSPDRADAFVLALYGPPTLGPKITAHLLSEESNFEVKKPSSPMEAVIERHYPVAEVTEERCATCAFQTTKAGQPDQPWCGKRGFEISLRDLACQRYEAAPKQGGG